MDADGLAVLAGLAVVTGLALLAELLIRRSTVRRIAYLPPQNPV